VSEQFEFGAISLLSFARGMDGSQDPMVVGNVHAQEQLVRRHGGGEAMAFDAHVSVGGAGEAQEREFGQRCPENNVSY